MQVVSTNEFGEVRNLNDNLWEFPLVWFLVLSGAERCGAVQGFSNGLPEKLRPIKTLHTYSGGTSVFTFCSENICQLSKRLLQ